ncbi:hypothetical protein [Aneurinibacillus tyrosinisolvens]|uniref:hypothetical protein n=1 Tax=Aneurinibacillus tyrosinisolvens TaxID=1443435 RepID=UPI000A883578|nr:hypothetical protein [Aneurinibacillus tyrosinisolvens]
MDLSDWIILVIVGLCFLMIGGIPLIVSTPDEEDNGPVRKEEITKIREVNHN